VLVDCRRFQLGCFIHQSVSSGTKLSRCLTKRLVPSMVGGAGYKIINSFVLNFHWLEVCVRACVWCVVCVLSMCESGECGVSVCECVRVW
jgi:hypothetical protein